MIVRRCVIGVLYCYVAFSLVFLPATAGAEKKDIGGTEGKRSEGGASKESGDQASSSGKSSNLFSESLFETSEGQPPLFIKSNTLSLDTKARTFTYEGNVEVLRGDLTVTSDVMIGHYDDNNRIKTIVCNKNVVITKGAEMRASSDRAIYDVVKGTIELTEGPELINRGNALTAEKVTIFVEEDRSEAEGDVRVRVIKATDGGQSKDGSLLSTLTDSSSSAPTGEAQ